ncbi:MAG: MOSC domain-containing protein [Hyphomicrobiaceae bacterium]
MSEQCESAARSVVALYRYPVKGLSPEPLVRIQLSPGETIPGDRAWAIENGPGGFDPDNPRYLPKIHFLMLMRDEKLATLETTFDEQTLTLTILRDGKQVARGNLATTVGRQLIEQFMAAYMKTSLRGAPKIVAAPGHSFSDMKAKCIHIVNLATVRDLERIVGRPLNALRFRPNIILDGVPAWQELDWVGRKLAIGPATLSIFHRTRRCAATDVDPEAGIRDLSIPAALQRAVGHSDFGVYGRVEAGGEIAVGNAVALD